MIVLDSSLVIAWLNERDAHHPSAARVMARVKGGEWGEALLPEYVFLETVTVLAAKRGLEFASRTARNLVEGREAEFVFCSPYFADAVDVFRTQVRTKLSFADAAIVAIARHRAGGVVATFDRDFSKVDGILTIPS